MAGRRKGYYHKTIVMRNVFGNTAVFGTVMCFFVVLACWILGQFHSRLTRDVVMKSMQTVFLKQEVMQNMPDIYDKIAEVFPIIQAAEERKKALLAQRSGVKKQEESQTKSEKAADDGTKIKAMDMSGKGISFRNETGYTPDVAVSLAQKLGFCVEDGKPEVLIMHTHTSEAYAESAGARSTDNTKNVVQVGSVLAKKLKEYGISVVHDTTRNDSPSYNGSYSKAMKSIAAQIERHPSIEIVLDVHRDYAEQTKNGEKVQLKPVTEIDGESVAQVMLVVGTDGLGLTHPDWKENLAFAIQIQEQLQKKSSKLARPINVRRERFNQHMTRGSLILEMGTAGNTVSECERAAEYVAEAIASVLKNYRG